MQSLSAFLPLAQTAASSDVVDSLIEQFKTQQTIGIGNVLLAFVVSQAVAILAYFIASKAVAERHYSIFPNALRVWILEWLLGIGALIAGVVVVFFCLAMVTPQVAVVAGVVVLVFTIVFAVRIPMDVYRIEPLAGIGFMLLAFVITIGLSFASGALVGRSPAKQVELIRTFTRLTPEQRKEFVVRIRNEQQIAILAMTPLQGEAEAKDTSRTLQQRGVALQQMYADLEARRQALPPGDEMAKLVYERQKQRYEAILASVKREVAQRNGKPN